MNPRRWLSLIALVTLAWFQDSHAQSGTLEIGLDGGIDFRLPDDTGGVADQTLASVGFPANQMRVGYFLSNAVGIESTLGLLLTDQELTLQTNDPIGFGDGNTHTTYESVFGLALGLHRKMGETRHLGFVKAGVLGRFTGATGNSDTQLGVEVGAGIKLNSSRHLGARVELSVARFFEGDVVAGNWSPSLRLGFSFLTGS